jgi:hypothetical protein
VTGAVSTGPAQAAQRSLKLSIYGSFSISASLDGAGNAAFMDREGVFRQPESVSKTY